MSGRGDDLQTSAFRARRFSLDHAVDLAANGLRNGRPYKHTDIVEAAEAFERFLTGVPTYPPQRRDLAELAAATNWFDSTWRSDFHAAVVEAIFMGTNWGTNWEAMADAVGDYRVIGEFDRALVKGVRQMHALWIGDGVIDQAVCETATYEIAPTRTIEFKFDEFEDKILADVGNAMYRVVQEGIASINSQAKTAIRSLLAAADFQLLESTEGDEPIWPVAPFRVEIVRWEGARSKEWTDEGAEYWHFWLRFKIGAAAFKQGFEVVDV